MQFSDDSLEEFQRIWKQDYGKEITKEEAREYKESLVNYFRILMEMDQRSKGRLPKGEDGL